MVGFSLVSVKALVWLVSDSWQAQFQVAFGLSQANTFSYTKNDEISPWPKHLQETQAQLQHMPLVWLDNFTGNIHWVSFLKKYCTNTLQACTCFQSKRFGGSIFEYRGTGNFLMASNVSGCSGSHMNSTFFFVRPLKLSSSSASLRQYLFQ